MNLKSFRIRLVLRVLLLGFAMAVLVYALYQYQWYVASSVSFFMVILIIIEMIRYVEKVNRELGKFLFSIKHKDFTNTFTLKDEGKSFSVLKDAFNEIIKEFQNVRIDKEVHYQYLNAVVNHINIAVICFDNNGNVQLINNAAGKLLNIPELTNIRAISEFHPIIYNVISRISIRKNELVKTKINDEMFHLTLQCFELKMRDRPIKLLTIQNIKNELETYELDSWQKLIRVLTHEIMNSVTPISSLSEAINDILQDETGKVRSISTIDKDDLIDLTNSVRAIENRSKGLINFVSSYKNLTRLPKPDYEDILVVELINRAISLLKNDLEKQQINLSYDIHEKDTKLNVDIKMIDQVLINIVKNAIEILGEIEDPVILIQTSAKDTNVCISIKDNGPGIDEEKLEKIFIPFFTTKQNGSGIGLSLSRQIMRLHGGTISVQSEHGTGTVFTLVF